MYTTALIVQVGERRICFYYTGRQHAGENLDALLAQREPQREQTAGDVGCVDQQQHGRRASSSAVTHAHRNDTEIDDLFVALLKERCRRDGVDRGYLTISVHT